METAQRNSLIERYQAGYQAVIVALDGVTDAELDAEVTDGWSIREIVHHLADSEMTSAIRLRRLLAEENPLISGYDEGEFARRLYYRTRPIASSLAAFKAAREATATILACMTAADWNRTGTHSQSGPYSAETWLEIYVAHANDHADQIRLARESGQTAG